MSSSIEIPSSQKIDPSPTPPVPPTAPAVPPTAPEAPPVIQIEVSDTKPKKKRQPYWPLIVYLVLSGLTILSYIFNPNVTLLTLLMNIVWVLIFAFIIYELCKHDHIGLAWFVVFLPLIISIVFFIFVLFAIGASS